MTTLFSLPVHTVHHVPRAARPLLPSALCREFSLSVRHGLWGFVRLLLFPKLVLRSPPRAGRKKRYLVGALLQDRLKQWMSGTGISDLWCAACAEGALFRSSTSSTTENLASSNTRRAIRWASEGRYGNALQAWVLPPLIMPPLKRSFFAVILKVSYLLHLLVSWLFSLCSPLLFFQPYVLSRGAYPLVAPLSILNIFWMLCADPLLLPQSNVLIPLLVVLIACLLAPWIPAWHPGSVVLL